MLKSQYKEALDIYLTSTIQQGGTPKTYKSISKAYKNLKQYDKAIKNLKKAKEFCHFDPEIYYEMGLNHLLSCNSEEARKNFKKAIRLDNKNTNAQIQLAISHELLGEECMAISIYKKIIEEYPKKIQAYNHLAGLYMGLKMFKDAAEVFYQILNINPDYYRANLGLGICFDKMEKYTQAVRFYKKYIVKKPTGKTARALAMRICAIYDNRITQSKGHLTLIKA
jgi:tetratricopeptide (TPR) repeat protein